jgi:hypothetical protein
MATICFDLDGTLCTNTDGAYEDAQPFPWAIARVNALARAGHRILIFTARGGTTGIDWRPVTEAQLERWGVSYDELQVGNKPHAHVFVDDRALHSDAWRYGTALLAPRPELSALDSDVVSMLGAGLAPPPRRSWVVEIGRTFGGAPFLLDEHAKRLVAAARAAGFPVLHSVDDVRAAVRDALSGAEQLGSGDEVVWSVGLSGVPHAAFADAPSEDLVPQLSAGGRLLTQVAEGLSPLLSGTRKVPGAAARTVIDGEGGWPLVVSSSDGLVSDALGGTLAVVRGETRIAIAPVSSRPVAVDYLAGLCSRLGATISEEPLKLGDLQSAKGAFLVGMPYCIAELTSLDGEEVERHPLVDELAALWSADVGAPLLSR